MGHELLKGYEHERELHLRPLTREFAEIEADRLAELAALIPGVDYTTDDILAESKSDGRVLAGKWDHSFVLCDNDRPVGLVMGYERAAEENDQYPKPTLYMSELAVDPEYRGGGCATVLVRAFLARALNDGALKHLDNAELAYSLQTNEAEWNESVRRLYERFGFIVSGRKQYPNRADVIMQAAAIDVSNALERGSSGEDHSD